MRSCHIQREKVIYTEHFEWSVLSNNKMVSRNFHDVQQNPKDYKRVQTLYKSFQ